MADGGGWAYTDFVGRGSLQSLPSSPTESLSDDWSASPGALHIQQQLPQVLSVCTFLCSIRSCAHVYVCLRTCALACVLSHSFAGAGVCRCNVSRPLTSRISSRWGQKVYPASRKCTLMGRLQDHAQCVDQWALMSQIMKLQLRCNERCILFAAGKPGMHLAMSGSSLKIAIQNSKYVPANQLYGRKQARLAETGGVGVNSSRLLL